jgi:hypothetical protein
MRSLVLVCLAIAIVGCSSSDKPKLVSVTGTVTMDSKPLTAGSINFHPDATNAYIKDKPSSLLQLDGSFVVKTYPFGDGVSPGKYKVTLSPELASRIKRPKYGKPEDTPWSLDVSESGITDLKLEVK